MYNPNGYPSQGIAMPNGSVQAPKTTNLYYETFQKLLAMGAFKSLTSNRSESASGTAIEKFSPNNVRRVILGLDGIYVQFYVGTSAFVKKSNVVEVTINDQLIQELVSDTTKSTPVLKVLHGDRKALIGERIFSSIEEIIILNQPIGFEGTFNNTGLDWFMQGEQVKKSFKRLRAVGIITEPVSLKEFLEENKHLIDDPLELVLGKTQRSKVGTMVADENYIIRTSLRPQYYKMDEEGGALWKYFQKVKALHEERILKEVQESSTSSDNSSDEAPWYAPRLPFVLSRVSKLYGAVNACDEKRFSLIEQSVLDRVSGEANRYLAHLLELKALSMEEVIEIDTKSSLPEASIAHLKPVRQLLVLAKGLVKNPSCYEPVGHSLVGIYSALAELVRALVHSNEPDLELPKELDYAIQLKALFPSSERFVEGVGVFTPILEKLLQRSLRASEGGSHELSLVSEEVPASDLASELEPLHRRFGVRVSSTGVELPQTVESDNFSSYMEALESEYGVSDFFDLADDLVGRSAIDSLLELGEQGQVRPVFMELYKSFVSKLAFPDNVPAPILAYRSDRLRTLRLLEILSSVLVLNTDTADVFLTFLKRNSGTFSFPAHTPEGYQTLFSIVYRSSSNVIKYKDLLKALKKTFEIPSTQVSRKINVASLFEQADKLARGEKQ